jgi:hypothetical protein
MTVSFHLENNDYYIKIGDKNRHNLNNLNISVLDTNKLFLMDSKSGEKIAPLATVIDELKNHITDKKLNDNESLSVFNKFKEIAKDSNLSHDNLIDFEKLISAQKTNELSPFDKQCIAYFETFVVPDHEELADYMKDFSKKGIKYFTQGGFLDPPVNGQILTKQGRIEIVKLLVEQHPQYLVAYTHMIDRSTKNELALAYVKNDFPFFIKHFQKFGVTEPSQLRELAYAGLEKNAGLILSNLKLFKCQDEKDIIFLIDHCAEIRPSLVLLKLDTLGIKDQGAIERIRAKCLEHKAISNAYRINDLVSQELISHPQSNKEIKATTLSADSGIEEVFNFFKTMSNDVRIEIAGRNMWSEYTYREMNPTLPHNYSEALWSKRFNDLSETIYTTKCGITSEALLSSIFGVRNADSKLETLAYNNRLRPLKFQKIKEVFEKNRNEFEGAPPSHFFAYRIQSNRLDHSFMIIQYKNDQNEIRYRLLQSWVEGHDLKEFMTNRSNSFNQEEFDVFLDGFGHSLMDERWSNDKAEFYNNYFMQDESFTLDRKYTHLSPNEKETFTLDYGSSNGEEIATQKAEFEEFKEKHIVTLLSKPIVT